MKDSKFWIWFIPILLIICVGVYMLLVMYGNTHEEREKNINYDAIKIKDEYEKLNDTEGMDKVTLSKDNSFSYASLDNIKEVFNGSDAIIYIGETSSIEARKSISILDEAISSTSITKVYYIDISKIDEEYVNYLKEKLDVVEVLPSMTITIHKGNIVNLYIPNINKEKESLLEDYQNLISSFIDSCDENC